MQTCSNGHEMREESRTRHRETVEEVVYTVQKIKHFDRHGSEFWAETNIPDLVEKVVEYDQVQFLCDACGEEKLVREDL